MHLLYYTLTIQKQIWHFDIKWKFVAKTWSCVIMMYFAITTSQLSWSCGGIISAHIVTLLNMFACSNKIYYTFEESWYTWLCYLSCWMVRLQYLSDGTEIPQRSDQCRVLPCQKKVYFVFDIERKLIFLTSLFVLFVFLLCLPSKECAWTRVILVATAPQNWKLYG
jgi:hypothetical protein